jgi:hypothetical protein
VLRAFALAAVGLLASPAAAAQERVVPLAEIASDLAYGYCPLFLAGQFPLTGNPKLTAFGFGSVIEKRQDARFGEYQTVTLKRADGEVAFGGASGKACSVVIAGAQRQAALAKLRETMSWMGLDFKPVPNAAAAPAGVTVETFRAPVDAQFLNVQLIQIAGATPAVVAQLYATDK